jgi:hypothetical protein
MKMRETVRRDARKSISVLPGVTLVLAVTSYCRIAAQAAESIVAYPAPPGEKVPRDYQVEAAGRSIFVYAAPVLHHGPASFAQFDLIKPVTVTVAVARKIGALKILPTSCGIQPAVADNKITFTAAKPAYLTLEPNGDGVRPLHLFINPPETDPPDPLSKDVIYFGPGLHEVTTIRPRNGQTVYLAGGAILRAKIPPGEKPVEEKNWRGNKVYATLIETNSVKGVKIRGRGILDLGTLPWHARTAMWFGNSQDILIEGITILDAPAWVVAMHNSKNFIVRNVTQICARETSDGIDICNSQDVLVEDCFLRNNDDEVCVKTISPPPALESKNIVVRRVVVWNDRARGLGITSETRANISNVLFQDCDIIHDWSQGGAALARRSFRTIDMVFSSRGGKCGYPGSPLVSRLFTPGSIRCGNCCHGHPRFNFDLVAAWEFRQARCESRAATAESVP